MERDYTNEVKDGAVFTNEGSFYESIGKSVMATMETMKKTEVKSATITVEGDGRKVKFDIVLPENYEFVN
jgi:hypothetical protein